MGKIYFGNTEISKIYRGNIELNEIYQGKRLGWKRFNFPSSFRYLVVAGGGGGGMDMGGGGGAGGLLAGTTTLTENTAYSITVGAGGAGAPAGGTNGQPSAHQFTISATNGGNSSFNGLTAIGGGYGGSSYYLYTPNNGNGNTGGSGGGPSGYSNGSTKAGAAGTAGQGNSGGQGGGQYYSGGGGGAGGAGANSTGQPNGGIGIQDDILGTAYYWAGGGGGSSYSLSTGGNGGAGGGGGGALGTTTGGSGLNAGAAGGGGSPNSWANRPGGNAGANTGGGGGGGSHYNSNNKGGDGGSGIVVVRYTGDAVFTGGTITTVGGDTVHTFTSSGTLIPLGYVSPYENLTFIFSSNITVTNNGTDNVDIFKTSGVNGWDRQAYSNTAFTAPCTIEFNKQSGATDNGSSYAMIGWNTDPTTNASYTSIDYASYPYRTDNYSVYNNGSQVQYGGAWSTANTFYIVYDTDGYIRHYNGSTLLYSANYGTGNTVYIDSSLYSPNGTYGGFSNVRASSRSWNGSSYV